MLFDPKPYQLPAIEFVKETPRCALHAGIGSGKTVISLTALYDLGLCLATQRTLFVAPLNVVLNTIPDEIALWDHTRTLTYSILHGDKKEERLRDKAELHVINYEGLAWFLASKNRQYYDLVVFDECHWIKSHKTKRFRMLRRFLEHVPRVLMMSGTPVGNSLLDLWSQFYLLDGGKRLMRSYDAFKRTYFRQADYMGFKWEPYDWTETAIIKKIQDITFEVHASDIELTKLVEKVIPCTLDSQAMHLYREFERNFFLEVDEAEIEAFNAASLCSKLRQFANGFLYWGDSNVHRRSVKRLHDAKFKILHEFVSHARQNIMIVCTFQEDFAELQRWFPEIPVVYGRTTPTHNRKVFQAWNNNELKLMAIHPRSVGTGLNLQDGGCLQVWLSPDWSYLATNQTHRQDTSDRTEARRND
jgi:superfamily II DNA or RNA helicase